MLVTIGAAVTWGMVTLLAAYVLGFSWAPACVTGAILTVTGPTVIGPMLRHIRPSRQIASTLKWEGIVIDPIGALLAVFVLESTVQAGAAFSAAVMLNLLKTIAIGTAAGIGSTFGNGLVNVNVGSIAGSAGFYLFEASLLPAIFVACNASANLMLVKGRAQFGIPAIMQATLIAYAATSLLQLFAPGLASAIVVRQ